MSAAQRELAQVERRARAALERFPIACEHGVRLLLGQALMKCRADHVLARGAETFFPGTIDEKVFPVTVAHGERERQRVEDLVGEFRLMSELGFCALELRDIGARAYETSHAAVRAAQYGLAHHAPLVRVSRPLMQRLDRRGGRP